MCPQLSGAGGVHSLLLPVVPLRAWDVPPLRVSCLALQEKTTIKKSKDGPQTSSRHSRALSTPSRGDTSLGTDTLGICKSPSGPRAGWAAHPHRLGHLPSCLKLILNRFWLVFFFVFFVNIDWGCHGEQIVNVNGNKPFSWQREQKADGISWPCCALQAPC